LVSGNKIAILATGAAVVAAAVVAAGAAVVAAAVGAAVGVAAQAVNAIAATNTMLKTKSKLFFILQSPDCENNMFPKKPKKQINERSMFTFFSLHLLSK
jgi:hypothetical protein